MAPVVFSSINMTRVMFTILIIVVVNQMRVEITKTVLFILLIDITNTFILNIFIVIISINNILRSGRMVMSIPIKCS